MFVQVKRIDKELPLPEYKTPGAAACDLYCRETIIIPPGKIRYIPQNIILKIPQDTWVLLAARSSAIKKGITQANGIGIGNYDFRGENDEYPFAALNITREPVTINRGDRIAQMIILERKRATIEEIETVNKQSRGSFGSTG